MESDPFASLQWPVSDVSQSESTEELVSVDINEVVNLRSILGCRGRHVLLRMPNRHKRDRVLKVFSTWETRADVSPSHAFHVEFVRVTVRL